MNFKQTKDRCRNRGISLIEVVVGTALILIALIGLVTAYSFYLKAGLKNTNTLKAAFLLQEGVEAMILMRDDAWSNLASLTPDETYFLSWEETAWEATTSAALIDGIFLRTVSLADVYRRDSDNDIVEVDSEDPKSIDPNSKKLTVVVSFETASTTQERQMVTYLTNLFE